MAMIYAWGPRSGLHINPAVTAAFTVRGRRLASSHGGNPRFNPDDYPSHAWGHHRPKPPPAIRVSQGPIAVPTG